MKLPGKMVGVLLSMGAAMPCALGAGPGSYPIRLEQVVRAVVAAHPELAGNAIALPEAPAAREDAPALEAGPVEHWSEGAGVGHVRLRCQSESVCLPFYASVRLPSQIGGPKSGLPGTAEPGLRAGAHASMVIDSGRLHLRIPVTCLSNGAVGSTIRVAGPTHSKVYEAAVIDQTTVRGSL